MIRCKVDATLSPTRLACLLATSLACTQPGSDDEAGSESAGETVDGETGEPLDCSQRPIDVPSARGELEGVWDAERERLVVFGGDQGTPVQCMSQTEFVAEVWAFHPDCDNFEALQPAAGMSPRGRYALAHDPARARALLHGGRYRAGTSGTYELYDDLWAFDLASDGWVALPGPGPTPRSNHVAAVVGDRLIVYGGNASTDGLAFTPLGDTWAFDLVAEQWSPLSTTNDPPARLFHAAAAHEGRVYVFGGGDENAFIGPFFRDLWVLEPESGAWTLLDDGQAGPPGTTWPDLVADPSTNRLLLWSGHDDGVLGNVNTLWAYELGGGGWSQLELGDVPDAPANGFCDFPVDFVMPDLDAPERRSGGAAALDELGARLFVFGGKTDCGLVNDVWSWSTADASWTEHSPATTGEICPRAFASCSTMCF